MMAVGNWSDHDRSGCHSVHDIALNHLQSCDQGALLFTFGDNDTFPLWYLQQVEGRRRDVEVCNINLAGFSRYQRLLLDNWGRRPVYFSQYAYERLGAHFGGRLRCEGYAWQLVATPEEAADRGPLQRHLRDSIRWHITPREYIDPVSQSLLDIWHRNTRSLAR